MITLFPSRCYNGGKQHRFEARVTKKVIPGELGRFSGNGFVAVEMIKAQTQVLETYHGDCCIWCGAVVNVPSPKKEG
jgi:hypothetical protein